jgi:hypothetical protein
MAVSSRSAVVSRRWQAVAVQAIARSRSCRFRQATCVRSRTVSSIRVLGGLWPGQRLVQHRLSLNSHGGVWGGGGENVDNRSPRTKTIKEKGRYGDPGP